MAKIFLFRHAQTTDNVDKIFCGKRNPELTTSGLEEAAEIREKLKNEKVTKAFCAPNTRTKHTLDIVLEPHSSVETVADPRLRERDYGDLTGKSKEEYEKLYPEKYKEWHRGYDSPPPNGESIKMVEERVKEFIKELIQNVWQNDVIFICASGNSIRPFRRYFEHLSIEEMCSFEHERGHIYEYEV